MSGAACPWLEAGFPPPGARAACGISGKSWPLPPFSLAFADHSQHPPRRLPSARQLCRVCLADAAHYEAERDEQGDGERGNQPGLPETLNLPVR